MGTSMGTSMAKAMETPVSRPTAILTDSTVNISTDIVMETRTGRLMDLLMGVTHLKPEMLEGKYTEDGSLMMGSEQVSIQV